MNIDKKYYQEINNNLTNTIQDTNIDAPNKKVGKVRDAYFLDEKVVMISTDRQSAFDRVLAAIPYKGAVLNSVSAWWFKKTEHLFPNHLISTPDPNVSIVEKCTVFPVEFVVRVISQEQRTPPYGPYIIMEIESIVETLFLRG